MTNIRLYTVLIVILFFVLGACGAVIAGRSMDFIEYRFYTDPTTCMPNRLRCDREIEKYARGILRFPFTGMALTLTNMDEINASIGRSGGNEVLHILADCLKECAAGYGFVGYNGGLRFLGLFPGCDEERAAYFAGMLRRLVSEFNRGGYGAVIRYRIAFVTSSGNTPYTMHELLAAADQKLRLAPVVSAEEAEPQDA